MGEILHCRMRRDLSEIVEAPVWPGDLCLQKFSEEHAAASHALLELSYAEGGGSVPDFAQWWSALSEDDEYDPDLCFLLCDRDGSAAAFAQCWTSDYIKDFVVHPRHRRRRVGRALLLHIFRAFRARGAEAVDLKVHIDNPSGAVQFYESLGMVRISRGPAV